MAQKDTRNYLAAEALLNKPESSSLASLDAPGRDAFHPASTWAAMAANKTGKMVGFYSTILLLVKTQ
jgi:hypothetical protein